MNDVKKRASHFILSAVVYAFGCEEEASRLSSISQILTQSDLKRVIGNAEYHKLEPLLHCICEDCMKLGYPLHIPDSFLDHLSAVYDRELARSAIILHGARKAFSALEHAGVRVVPLKGVYLSSRFYEMEGARSFRDLDLLVERDALPALNEALLGSGFLPHPGRPSFVPAPAYTVYFLPMENSDLNMEIDIHVGLHWPQEYFRRTSLRPEDLWSEACPYNYEGTVTWSMSLEHLVITTLLDVAINHRYALLIKFRDIVEIMHKMDIDWASVIEWCQTWKVVSFVSPGLSLLKGLLAYSTDLTDNLSIPVPTYLLLKLFSRELAVEDLPDRRARAFSPSNLLFFLLADTFRERARGLIHMPGHILRGRRRF
ncbi:MAG: nucleotidyltransferase family protein [Actinomycetota bacterium]|nr:nucleotidyltransferase family protein [Actinomycetota bacterium]